MSLLNHFPRQHGNEGRRTPRRRGKARKRPAILVEALEMRTVLSAAAGISTDLADYAPSDVAQISGHDFDAGETVSLSILRNDDGAVFDLGSVIADSDGNIASSWTVEAGDSYTLYATGNLSSPTVSTPFTDTKLVASATVTAQAVNLNAGTAGEASFTVTLNRTPGTHEAFFVKIFLPTSLPTGASSTLPTTPPTPYNLTFPKDVASASKTFKIITSASTPAGSYPFIVTTQHGDVTSDAANATGTLVINGPPTLDPIDTSGQAYVCQFTNNLQAVGHDPEGEALTYSVGGSDASAVTIVPLSGAMTFAPTEARTYNFTVTATDPHGLYATRSVSIFVSNTGLDNNGNVLIGGTTGADRIAVTFTGANVGNPTLVVNYGNQPGLNKGVTDLSYTSPIGSYATSLITGTIIVHGGDGDDYISVGSAPNSSLASLPGVIDGGGGADLIYGGAGASIIYGGTGNDSLNGGPAADVIYGGGDDDSITGGTGNDLLYGEAGDDTLMGSDGDDILVAGDGADKLGGGLGRDLLIGGDGADTLVGNEQEDILVAAMTAFDAPTGVNQTKLMNILAAWESGDAFADRITTIRVTMGSNGLNLGTVIDDADMDTLYGDSTGGGTSEGLTNDWFIMNEGTTDKNKDDGKGVVDKVFYWANLSAAEKAAILDLVQ